MGHPAAMPSTRTMGTGHHVLPFLVAHRFDRRYAAGRPSAVGTMESPMRGTRWLILTAIIALLGGVALTYRLQSRENREQAPPKPQAMAPELSSAAQDWSWIE